MARPAASLQLLLNAAQPAAGSPAQPAPSFAAVLHGPSRTHLAATASQPPDVTAANMQAPKVHVAAVTAAHQPDAVDAAPLGAVGAAIQCPPQQPLGNGAGSAQRGSQAASPVEPHDAGQPSPAQAPPSVVLADGAAVCAPEAGNAFKEDAVPQQGPEQPSGHYHAALQPAAAVQRQRSAQQPELAAAAPDAGLDSTAALGEQPAASQPAASPAQPCDNPAVHPDIVIIPKTGGGSRHATAAEQPNFADAAILPTVHAGIDDAVPQPSSQGMAVAAAAATLKAALGPETLSLDGADAFSQAVGRAFAAQQPASSPAVEAGGRLVTADVGSRPEAQPSSAAVPAAAAQRQPLQQAGAAERMAAEGSLAMVHAAQPAQALPQLTVVGQPPALQLPGSSQQPSRERSPAGAYADAELAAARTVLPIEAAGKLPASPSAEGMLPAGAAPSLAPPPGVSSVPAVLRPSREEPSLELQRAPGSEGFEMPESPMATEAATMASADTLASTKESKPASTDAPTDTPPKDAPPLRKRRRRAGTWIKVGRFWRAV